MSWGRVQHSNNTLHRTTHSQSHRGLSSWVKLRCRLSSVRCAGRFFLLKTKTKRPSHKETGTQRAQMLLKEAWEDPRYLLIFQRSWAYKGCCAFLLVGKNIFFSSLLEKDIWFCGNSVWNTLPCNGVKLIYNVMHAHATVSSFASASDQVSCYFFYCFCQLRNPSKVLNIPRIFITKESCAKWVLCLSQTFSKLSKKRSWAY